MDYYKLLQEKLGIQIDSDSMGHHYDLEISTYYTADNYDIYVMTNDPSNIDFENDVYYYEPSAEDILYRIDETAKNGGTHIYIDDPEDRLPDDEIKEWLEDNYNIDEDEN